MNNNRTNILMIILILSFFYCIYEINNLKKIEGFTTNTATQEQVNTAVKRIYLADVEAIRLLSNFAIQLSQGGTTVPGSVTFSGNNIVQGGDISGSRAVMIGQGEVKLVGTGAQHYSIINKEGKFSIENTSDNGNLGSTLGNKLIEITGNYSRDNVKSQHTVKVNDTVFNLTAATDISGALLGYFPTIDLGANDTRRAIDAGKISYGVGDGNALNIFGKAPSSLNNQGQRFVRIWDKLQVDYNIDAGTEINVNNSTHNKGVLNVYGTINCNSIKIGDWTFSTNNSKDLIVANNSGKGFAMGSNGNLTVNGGINGGIAGYVIITSVNNDNVMFYEYIPISVTMKTFVKENQDSLWLINPGFKVQTYSGRGFSSEAGLYDNTTGTSQKLFSTLTTFGKVTRSFIVYYNNVPLNFCNFTDGTNCIGTANPSNR
jgi:hypothetical protein